MSREKHGPQAATPVSSTFSQRRTARFSGSSQLCTAITLSGRHSLVRWLAAIPRCCDYEAYSAPSLAVRRGPASLHKSLQAVVITSGVLFPALLYKITEL